MIHPGKNSSALECKLFGRFTIKTGLQVYVPCNLGYIGKLDIDCNVYGKNIVSMVKTFLLMVILAKQITFIVN